MGDDFSLRDPELDTNKALSHNYHSTGREDMRSFSSRVDNSISKAPVDHVNRSLQGTLPVSAVEEHYNLEYQFGE
jgi:hypothetical protein